MEIKIWINRDLGKSMMKASAMDFVSVKYKLLWDPERKHLKHPTPETEGISNAS